MRIVLPGQSPVKLGIALPCGDYGRHIQFWDSFTRMQKPFPWTYIRPTHPIEFYGGIADVRNELVLQAFDSDCTHILMLDTDQTPEPQIIPKLFAHGLPIVCARVHRRYPPYDPILKRRDPETGRYSSIPDSEWMDAGLLEVDGTGVAACGLFDISVFENIPSPWFETVHHEDRGPTGEDFYFCEKAKESGYRIMVDCSLEVGHLTTFEVNRSWYLLYKKLLEIGAESEQTCGKM